MNKMTVMTRRCRLKGRPPSETNLQTARHTPHSWKYWSSTDTLEVPQYTKKYLKVPAEHKSTSICKQHVTHHTTGCIGHPQGDAIYKVLSLVYAAGQGHGQNRAHPTEPIYAMS